MILVAVAAVVYWRLKTTLPFRWFWVGAGLWIVAVAIKFAIAIPVNPPVFKFLGGIFPYPAFVLVGGFYGGLLSSLTEIGLTWLAVVIWRDFGRNADRAIGIGVGAGAFEAFLLGFGVVASVSVVLAGIQGTEPIRKQIDAGAASNLLFWLIGPVERVTAVLCHASSRALVILGTVHRRPWMIFSGFAIFTLLDGIVTAAHLAGIVGKYPLWWIELALAPAALISIPILRWCDRQWGCSTEVEPVPTAPGLIL